MWNLSSCLISSAAPPSASIPHASSTSSRLCTRSAPTNSNALLYSYSRTSSAKTRKSTASPRRTRYCVRILTWRSARKNWPSWSKTSMSRLTMSATNCSWKLQNWTLRSAHWSSSWTNCKWAATVRARNLQKDCGTPSQDYQLKY